VSSSKIIALFIMTEPRGQTVYQKHRGVCWYHIEGPRSTRIPAPIKLDIVMCVRRVGYCDVCVCVCAESVIVICVSVQFDIVIHMCPLSCVW